MNPISWCGSRDARVYWATVCAFRSPVTVDWLTALICSSMPPDHNVRHHLVTGSGFCARHIVQGLGYGCVPRAFAHHALLCTMRQLVCAGKQTTRCRPAIVSTWSKISINTRCPPVRANALNCSQFQIPVTDTGPTPLSVRFESSRIWLRCISRYGVDG